MPKHASFFVPPEQQKAPDAILGVSKLFNADSRPDKINAGIGVYADQAGTFTPKVIKEVAANLPFGSADYLGPTGEEEYLGDRKFLEGTARVVFGKYADKLFDQKLLATIGTVGGTSAVNIIVDSIHELTPDSPMLIGVPTWPNHLQITEAKKVKTLTYQHMTNNKFDSHALLDTITKSPEDTVVLFHTGKTHNPTGVNPQTADEWRSIARAMDTRRALFDTPYAGFADGLEEDTEAIRIFMEEGINIAVAVSYAKNGGLYRERPAALLVPLRKQAEAIQMQRFLNYRARVSYSSPPAFGERIMGEILSDANKMNQWKDELKQIADDLKARRKMLATEVPALSFVAEQTGLFSILPLQLEQVGRLQQEHAVYMPATGRVNFGGITQENMANFAKAVKSVL